LIDRVSKLRSSKEDKSLPLNTFEYAMMSPSVKSDEVINWVIDDNDDGEGDKKEMRRTSDEVLRRTSEMTTKIDEFDLSENYQNAIDCLISCESIIRSLQNELAAKDKKIEKLEKRLQRISKDDEIVALEGKIVKMSLDLALTKARADALEHQLKTKSSGVPPLTKGIVDNYDGSDNNDTPTQITFNDAKWQPRPISRNRKTSQSCSRLAQKCCVDTRNPKFDRAETSRSTATKNGRLSIPTSFSAKMLNRSTFNDINIDDSNTSRLTQFSQLFLNLSDTENCGVGEVQVQFPKTADDEKIIEKTVCNVGGGIPRRQPTNTNPKITQRQNSNRSFLEKNGVIFPVSSEEVLQKGCRMHSFRDDQKPGSNEAWPEFR